MPLTTETTTPRHIYNTAPEIADQLLQNHSYFPVASTSPSAFVGRNSTWIITLTTEEKIFAKELKAEASGPMAFKRSTDFAAFASTQPDHAPASPSLLASDPDSALLLFEYCSGTSLAQLLVEERIPENFSEIVGRSLALLHTGDPSGLEPVHHPSPPVEMLSLGVPQTRYIDFTLAEIKLWSELQKDQELVEAAAQLRADEITHQQAPVHADLRLDQFHYHNDELQLLDWEEFGLGDPARDLGTLAGEWIYRAVLDTVTTRANASAPPMHFSEETATERIAERMATLLPNIEHMWRAYTRTIGTTDTELRHRATAHLGWHLIDRTISRAQSVSRLPGIERAAAGIGRKALLAPTRYADALGFSGRTSS